MKLASEFQGVFMVAECWCRRSMLFSDCNRGLCFFKIVGGSGYVYAFFALLLCCGYVALDYYLVVEAST